MEHLPVDIGKVASIRFNVMVVGEIGCGKTTFLESFPRGYSDDQNTLHGAALDAHLHFIDTTEVPEVDATVEGNIDGAVQRPGWSVLNISNVDVLPEYLVSKHREWVKISTKLVISDEERNAKDERVHCLFYFFGPHPVPFYEEAFLKAISGLVPIVPILSKADSLTVVERERYQQQIQKLIGTLQNAVDLPVAFNFGDNGVANAKLDQVLPAKRDFGTMNSESADTNALVADHEGEAGADSGGSGEGEGDGEYDGNGEGDGDRASDGSDEQSDQASRSSRSSPTLEAAKPASATTTTTEVPRAHIASDPGPWPAPATVFALVCSGSESGLREYPWGCSVSAYDERVSDLRRLQRLVFERGNIARLRDLTQHMTIALHQRDQQADKQKEAGEEESVDGAEQTATA